MPGTSMMEPWWAPRRVSLLHWTSLRGTAPLWASTSTNPSPFLLSPASVTPQILPYHQISPSPEETFVSSATPSDQNRTVKRSCRTESRELGSLWPRSMICRTPNWRPPSYVHVSPTPNSPTSFEPPLRATSSRQPGISIRR